MEDRWQVVTVSGKWGTEYYIQDRSTGRTLCALDGLSAFSTTNWWLADAACQQANEESRASDRCLKIEKRGGANEG